MSQNHNEYGCTVCRHKANCEPNAFGICKDFLHEAHHVHFTPDQVKRMSRREVRENYNDIMESMKEWG